RSTTSRMTRPARSSGRTSASAPPYRPIGVRIPARTTARVMRSLYELHVDRHAGARVQLANRLPPLVAVVARQVVHVHRDELVAARDVHAPAEAERVVERLVAMRERRVDRLPEDVRHLADDAVAEVAPDRVHPERQRQARLEEPPLAEVEALVQPCVAVGQLALVDQQPRL